MAPAHVWSLQHGRHAFVGSAAIVVDAARHCYVDEDAPTTPVPDAEHRLRIERGGQHCAVWASSGGAAFWQPRTLHDLGRLTPVRLHIDGVEQPLQDGTAVMPVTMLALPPLAVSPAP